MFEKGWPFQWYLWHYCFKADRQIWCEVNVLTLTFVLIWTADRIHLYIFFLYVKKDKVYKAMEFKSWMQCRENETQREERKCLRCGHKVIWLLSGHVFYSFFFFFLLRAFYWVSPGVGIACQCKLAESFNCCNIFSYHLWRMSTMVPWRWCGFLNVLSFICSMMLYLLLSIYDL